MTSLQTISTAELHEVLEIVLDNFYGTRTTVSKLDRKPSVYQTSFAIEELNLVFGDNVTLELIFKDLCWDKLAENTREVKPHFLYDPLREIETYRLILSSAAKLGTATCYGTAVDPHRGRYWLFLEKVPGVELYQVGSLAVWQRVAQWLASLHALFDGAVEQLRDGAHLLTYDASYYRLWLCRAQAFSRRSGQTRKARRGIDWLSDRYERVVERLISLPYTLLHGEFYPSNILVQESEEGVRVCPIDWEMAAMGPAFIDLAALASGKWTELERASLAEAYHGALPTDSDTLWTLGALREALQYCQIAVAVQWLGWAPNWVPPSQHAHDWLGDALSLAEELDL